MEESRSEGMMSESGTDAPTGPDMRQGVPLRDIPEAGLLAGHVDGEPVLLSRSGGAVHAVSGACTHYGAPLAEGLVVGETIRCPWHHACFSLRTGEALHAPALSSVACWLTEVGDGKVRVRTKLERAPSPRVAPGAGAPARIVIVGGGAAGFAA